MAKNGYNVMMFRTKLCLAYCRFTWLSLL